MELNWTAIICTAMACFTAGFVAERILQTVFELRVFVNQWLQIIRDYPPRKESPDGK